MKKLLLGLSVVLFSLCLNAQTGFPSTDSLHRYNNVYIRNSAVEAFSNLRLNTLLHGIIAWIDTARTEDAGGAIGIDSIALLNDSTIRYRKNSVFYTINLPSIYGARNGLTAFGGVIGFGGTLVDDTTVLDFDGNVLDFHGGQLLHRTGDYVDQVSDYSILENSATYSNNIRSDGALTTEIFSTLASGGQVKLQAQDATSVATVQVTPSQLYFNQSDGDVRIANLIDSVQAKAIYYDPASGKLTYGDAASGTGGGSGDDRFGVSTGDDSASADREFFLVGNGITFNGGQFIHGTGDFNDQVTAYNRLENNSTLFSSNIWDGSNAAGAVVNSVAGGQGIFDVQEVDGSGNMSEFYVGGALSSIHLIPYSGNLFVHNLIDSSQAYTLHYNPTNHKVTYALNGGGGGGGGTGGLSLNSANGLANRNDSTLILGSALDQQTTIDGGASYSLNVTGARTIGASTLTAANTNGGAAFTATSPTGTAISATSTSSVGASITAGSEPLIVTKTSVATNTMSQIADFRHTTSNTATNGFGGYNVIRLEDAAGALQPASYWAARWQSASLKSSAVDIYNFKSNSAQRVFTIDSAGRINDSTYGYLKHEGTPTSYAAFDTDGNLVEVDPDDMVGGGGAVTTDATLTGNGTTTPLGVNTSVIATTDYVDAKELAGGTTLSGWTNVLSLTGVVANAALANTVGATPTGTDISTAVNAWITSAPAGATLLFPRTGTGFRLTQPLTYPSGKKLNVIIEGSVYFGTSNGIIMDGYMQTLDARKGNIYGTNQTAGTPNYGSQTNTGVWVRSCESCRIDLGEVSGFKYGNQVGGFASGTSLVQGAQFNRITFAYLRRNSVGVYVHPSGGTTNSNGNWANANGWWGGKITGDSGVVFRPDVTQGDRFNGNNFYQIGFENGGSTSIQMKCAIYLTFAVNNSFFGCRFEPTPITKKLVATTDVDNTNFFGTSYFQWDWLDAPGNNIHVDGPIYDGISGISVGNEAEGYRYSGTSTFYNQRVKVKGTTRSVSAILNVPSNIDVEYTNETSVSTTAATYTVAAGISLVRVNYAAGVASITLPAAASNPDRVVIIKNLNASNAVAVVGQSNIATSGVGQYRSAGGSWIKIN